MCVKGSSLACHGQLLWALRFSTAQLHMCGFKQAMVNQGDAQDTDLMLTTGKNRKAGKKYVPPLSFCCHCLSTGSFSETNLNILANYCVLKTRMWSETVVTY